MTNQTPPDIAQTHYRFDRPVTYALQRLKLRPKDNAGQTVVDWDIDIDGGKIQSACEDAHLNHVALVSVDSGRTEISIKCSGTVETTNSDGIIGKHRGQYSVMVLPETDPADDRWQSGRQNARRVQN